MRSLYIVQFFTFVLCDAIYNYQPSIFEPLQLVSFEMLDDIDHKVNFKNTQYEIENYLGTY